MKVNNLEKAKGYLVNACLELDRSIESSDNQEDSDVTALTAQRSSIGNFIGILEINIAKLKEIQEHASE